MYKHWREDGGENLNKPLDKDIQQQTSQQNNASCPILNIQ